MVSMSEPIYRVVMGRVSIVYPIYILVMVPPMVEIIADDFVFDVQDMV